MEQNAHIADTCFNTPERGIHLPLRIPLPFSERRLLLVLIDALVINLAVLAAMWLWAWVGVPSFSSEFVRPRWFWFPLFTVSWWGLAWLSDLYSVPVASRHIEILGRIAGVLAGLGICYLVGYFVLPRDALPRLFFLFFSASALLGMVLWRWSYATLFRLPQLCRRILIVGAGWAGRTLVQALESQDFAHYQAIGFVDDDLDKQGTTIASLPVLGNSQDITSLVRRYDVDEIVLAVTHHLSGDLFQALMDCRALKAHVVRMPDLYEQLTLRVPVEHINEAWVLDALNGSSPTGYLERAARRCLDLVFGLVGLLALISILPFVALAIYLSDRGPVFYTQVRSGQGGHPFRVIKFRTMRCDAEKDGNPQWAQENDERITPIGRFLRKVRLDELPQVINVLRGEMSIVGPRPERPEFIVKLERQIPFYRTRLVVKPGLTGWAQTHHEYGNTVKDALIKLQYDLYYIRHRSIWLDLYTISRTVGVVLRGEGM
ncbi:MAG: sugar transferase [Anaerolineae bacterium]|nr:sugar transferase [Anaerolineae bacterium]